MNADRLMVLDVTSIDRDTPLKVAWHIMTELEVRHLPVVENGKLLGILSDRDLLIRAQRTISGAFEFPDLCAAEVMSFHPVTCSAHTSVTKLAALMLEHHIDSVPIVNDAMDLLGIVTSTDLLKVLVALETASPRLPFTFQLSRHARKLTL